MRIALGVEYDGSGYHGWQRQEGALSVQQVVEEALSRVAAHPVRVSVAGRTDTGVHAVGQVIHFDSDAVRDERAWVFGGNVNMPRDVSFLWARRVEDDFHARFLACARRYRYIIANRWTRPAIHRTRASWFHRPLDVERMRAGAVHLLGQHDFTSFRAVACQAKSPIKTIHEIEVTRVGEYVAIDVRANAFLHHMVRNIAGVLMTVGCGDREPEWVAEVLGYRDRALGGVTAPPDGLYFVHVEYPERFELPPCPSLPVLA
ncbi:MAG: tRNA pseudouridine(38-40) synthase TruA [Chromatiales bacterium]|nr:tRNA pseudouridine(38-40) synthase TruA [Chromatiales bacterium]